MGLVPDPAESQTLVSLLGRNLIGNGALLLAVQIATARCWSWPPTLRSRTSHA